MPVKERERRQKDGLWQEVSKCLKGVYTSAEAEKRWMYLKDCYRKSRNTYKKQKQNILHKNGAADILKHKELKPSFRHYNLMTFLNNTSLEHRHDVGTSTNRNIFKKIANEEACSTNSNDISTISPSDIVEQSK